MKNRLLGALPTAELQRVLSRLEVVSLEQKQTLYQVDEPIRHVFFPESAVLSLLITLRQGGSIEVGTVGREGMAGLPVFLSDGRSTVTVVAQIPGTAYRAAAADLHAIASLDRPMHGLLMRYTHAALAQVQQTAACNSAHRVEQRCARWMLMTRDRVDADDFPVTHDFLASMLGVRRSGVTVAMRTLKDAGLVRYTRGRVHLVDRAGLEGASCECYRVVRAQFERLIPEQLPA